MCGFTLASNEVIHYAESKVIAPYPISAPVAEIASQARTSNMVVNMYNQTAASISIVKNNEQLISDWLNDPSLGVSKFSPAMQILFYFAQLSKKHVFLMDKAKQGILIRDQSKQLQLKNCLRILVSAQ